MDFISRLRQRVKKKFDLISNEKLKQNLLSAVPFWVGAFISGGVAVLYAKLFQWSEMGGHFLFQQSKWSFFILTPLCFIVAWWLVKKYAPYSRGSGIPQVSAAIELSNARHTSKVNSLLSVRVIIIKLLSSLVMVFGGGAIGREGPTIQISASIFNKINNMLPAWYPKISKQNMIVTGAAAGLAAAFNTPLGGIVFAIEELARKHFNFFKSALLAGVIISGLTALSLLGPYLYLGYPQLYGISAWVVLPITILALITGVAGSGMGQAILYVLKKKRVLKNTSRNILFLLIFGLTVASIAAFFSSDILGSGKELMTSALFSEEKNMPWYTPILRIIGPVFAFSTGASGGIFAPSLSAGASIGAVISGWFESTPVETNLLILCGMTGFLTSITRSPFTSSILILEMTNSHHIIFYIMLTSLIANFMASLITRQSFYDQLKSRFLQELHKNGNEVDTQREAKT